MHDNPELSPAARDFLERHASDVKPSMVVGSQGVTEGVVAALDRKLGDDELVKVRVVDGWDGEPEQVGRQLAAATGAALCEVSDRVITLFRPHEGQERSSTSLWVPN